MKKGILLGFSLLFGLLWTLPPVGAQLKTQGPGASAQLSLLRRETVYKLNDPSGYTAGCILCGTCAIWYTPDFRGTFALKQLPTAGPFWTVYEVSKINWLVSFGQGELRLTGSGQYKINAGAQQQQLTLDISFDGAPPFAFDSGVQQTAAGFPNLSIGNVMPVGAGCATTSLQVDASPVKPQAYQILDGSSYANGCIGPLCACPIVAQNLVGSFGLVSLGQFGGMEEYALVNVSWYATAFVPNPPLDPAGSIKGVGIYRFGGGVHEMLGEFNTPGAGPLHFGSGQIPGGGSFPTIDIAVIDDATGCINHSLGVIAAPQ